MATNSINLSAKVWQTLHNNHEKYEHYALVIKLFSIALVVIAISVNLPTMISLLLLFTLWLQEGIWKTYQARTSDAIITLECAIKDNDDSIACRLYSDWQDNRPRGGALIQEYISSALKPTVMFPYIPLMVISIIAAL
ncbi:hypothetical protein GCM10009111_14530 [Colwellia asteriadis]|uniref:Uncharacterized protein n=1 Tax=Colwellia asteriadis TaxID=517723 RepID=A0ABP3WF77_9GAMM